ncbi:hypothetical protein ACFLWY_02445 [Chloroflexota bacterium]
MNDDTNRGTAFKLAIVWLAILLMGSFWLTVRISADPISLAVVPAAPREGEPIIATFKLNNPSTEEITAEYQFYANGELLKEGTTVIAARSSKVYQYACKNSLPLGEQINFVVRASSPLGEVEEIVSLPTYPPQIWSSFTSFASFSTSLMGTMSSMTYYNATFGDDIAMNIGLLVSLVLISLLIFMEMAHPGLGGRTVAVVGRLRLRFGTLAWILFIIFMGMVYTKVVIILAV